MLSLLDTADDLIAAVVGNAITGAKAHEEPAHLSCRAGLAPLSRITPPPTRPFATQTRRIRNLPPTPRSLR